MANILDILKQNIKDDLAKKSFTSKTVNAKPAAPSAQKPEKIPLLPLDTLAKDWTKPQPQTQSKAPYKGGNPLRTINMPEVPEDTTKTTPAILPHNTGDYTELEQEGMANVFNYWKEKGYSNKEALAIAKKNIESTRKAIIFAGSIGPEPLKNVGKIGKIAKTAPKQKTMADLFPAKKADTQKPGKIDLLGQDSSKFGLPVINDSYEAIKYVQGNTSKVLKEYDDLVKKEFNIKKSNVVSSDVGKYAIPGFNKLKSDTYHEAGSWLAKKKAAELLADKTTLDKPGLFLSGGTGAGKTTGLRKAGDLGNYSIIWDGNLNNYESAVKKLDQFFASGREKAFIYYVHRDPVTAFREGVVPRIKKEGRIVPIYAHIDTHSDALPTVQRLAKKYGDKLEVRYIDNTGKSSSDAKIADFDKLRKFSYTKDGLRKQLIYELNQAQKQARVSQEDLKVFLKEELPRDGRQGSAKLREVASRIGQGKIKPAGKSGNVNIPQTKKAGFLYEKKAPLTMKEFLAGEQKTAPSAVEKINGQTSRSGKQGEVQGVESLIPGQRKLRGKTKEEQIKETLSLSQKNLPDEFPQSPSQKERLTQSQSKLKSQDPTLEKAYTKNNQKTIENTAQNLKEQPALVKRVIDSLRETRTKIIEYVQNTDERWRQLTSRKDVKISDVSDPYLKMTLYPGRVASKIEKAKTETESIIKDMVKLKISRKDVSDYLRYRHAPERNAALGENAAGITTAEANTGLRALENSASGSKIREMANRVQELNNQTLEILKESGVISSDLYKTLREKYKNHVPLNRILENTEDVGGVLSGKGYNVRSTGIKRAKGSDLEVDDIMANVVTNYEQAVLRAEKNIVDQATLAFARENKDILGGLLEVVKPKAIGKTFDGRVIMEKTSDPTILQLFENGKPIWIKIKNPDLAVATQGVGREKIASYLNPVAKFTRLFAGLATRFNPEFALPNKIRDLQETAVYLAAQNKVGFKGAAKMAARDAASVKDVVDAIRGGNSDGAKLYREMKELGGTTGGFGLSTKENVKLDMERVERLAGSKGKQFGKNILEYIDNWNTIFEDSTRLSVYKQALGSGLSKDRAAAMAKEASINFNRMGKGGPAINALYMFSNASIQGSAKMIRSLKNPKVLGAVAVAVGSSVAVINQFNDHADKDWRDKIPKWDRLNGLPVVLPSNNGTFRYFTIPVSWGIKPIKVMADYAYDAVIGFNFEPRAMIEDIITAIAEAYNPLGGTDFLSTITPTILDVPFEVERNKSWSGVKIRPDYDKNAPADIQYFSSLKNTLVGKSAISISEALQKNTGLAVSPANIKYYFEQYVGGAGRTLSKTLNLISSIATKKELPLDEYPMLSRFYRERSGEEIGAGAGVTDKIKKLLEGQSRERFAQKQQAEELFKNLQGKPKEEIKLRLFEATKKDPKIVEKMTDIAKDEAKGLNYTDRMIKQLGVENGERAKYILQRVKEMKTPGEKKAYILELGEKGLLTKEVIAQMVKEIKK